MSMTIAGESRNWWRHAACRERLDLDWIEPGKREIALCRAICVRCPVLAECRQAALSAGEAWGVWGGLNPDERAVLAAQHGYPPPTVLPAHGTNARYAKHRCRCPSCRHAHTQHERRRRNGLAKPDTSRDSTECAATTIRTGQSRVHEFISRLDVPSGGETR
jgi:hypothetical protein